MIQFKISEARNLGMATETIIHANIFLVLVGECVVHVVVNLFEYWSVPVTVDTSLHMQYVTLILYVLHV